MAFAPARAILYRQEAARFGVSRPPTLPLPTFSNLPREADTTPAYLAGSQRVIYAAIAGNAAIAASKFFVAMVTGSAVMLAEGIHSVVDTGNELLLLLGSRRSLRPADSIHPFGYGKELYFWSLLVAMLVFALGSGLSIYEGIARLLSHEQVLSRPAANYIVLAVAAVFEFLTWMVAQHELNRFRPRGLSLWATIQRSKDPSVFSVFLEDTCALAGLAVAAAGIFLSHRFGLRWLDPAASLVVGGLLAGAAWILARESRALLVGESATEEQIRAVRDMIAAEPAVEQVGRLFTMQLGPGAVLMTANIRFRRELKMPDLEAAIDRIERQARAIDPTIRHIFLEAESLRATPGVETPRDRS